jgi:integrase
MPPLHARNVVAREYKPLLEAAGLPPIPWKNFRHSHLSHLQRAGAPIAVAQQRAGHASSQLTLDVYTKVQVDEQRGAVRRIEAELFPHGAQLPMRTTADKHGHDAATTAGGTGVA